MTRYLMKLPYVPNPIVIDSKGYQNTICKGLYLNFFRQYKEFEWIKKI